MLVVFVVRMWGCQGASEVSAGVSSVALHDLGVGGEVALSVGRAGGGSSGLSGGGAMVGGTCVLTLRCSMQAHLCSCSLSHVVVLM